MAHEGGLGPADVVRRALVGAVSLGGGQVAAQALNIGGLIVLARILTPAEFGLVAILTFFLSLLTALGDLGLGMSLVRQPVEPDDGAYRAVASFQQAVAIGVALASIAATPLVVWAYELPASDWWLFPAMAVAILADAVRFLPLVRLERRLVYERVGAIELAQAVVFNITLVALASSGAKAASFTVAVMVRSVVGAIVAHAIGPRLSGRAWHWPIARAFLAFGLPYQGVHLLTVARASIIPVFVGLLLGTTAVGHLEWAAMVAGFPLTGLILFQRLYVGSFSRLQGHPAELGAFVTSVVSVAHAVVAPVALVTIVLLDPIVHLVFGDAWAPAIPLVRWLWLGCLAVPTIAPLTGLLHALGQSRLVFRSVLAASILTWVAGIPLVLVLGEIGMAIASLSVHTAGLVVWRAARRLVTFRVLGPAMLVWLAAVPAGAAAWWWHEMYPLESIAALVACGAVALLLHGAVLAVGVFAFGAPVRASILRTLERDTR
jgi:O-antigen/teichoic acid export membrane protein